MRPTQEDVARKARVSRALVSLVMREAPNVSDRSRRKVLRAADELGYRPNAYARSLASKRVTTIGVLINDVANPYFGGVYSSLAEAAAQAGFDLLVEPGTRSAAKEATLVRTLLEHQVAGLVLLSPLLKTSELQRLTASWPTVMVGRRETIPGVDVVTSDEEYAARSMIKHLVDLGHSDIVHLSGGSRRAATDRSRAYRRAMEESGLQPREITSSFTPEGGRRAGHEVATLRPLPTAVVAANDLIAVGAMGVFQAQGIRVPEDISVVGFDDSQIAQLDLIQLTSIRQQVDLFGTTAMSLLVDRIENRHYDPVLRLIETELMVRRTTGASPAVNRG